MDKPKVAEKLGASPGGNFQIMDMRLVGWGADVIFAGIYEIEGTRIPFEMKLHDCRELHWRVYAHAGKDDGTRPPAALVNLRLGSDQHRKPLNMLTDYFGLTVMYGELTVSKPE